MSDWTVGLVKDRNMQVEAYCETGACRNFYRFDIDALIESVGADFRIDDIPPMTCEACGGPLKIMLAMANPNDPEDGSNPGSGGFSLEPS